MAGSSSILDLVTTTSATKEAVLNALFDAASPAMLWGRQASACSGLTWGYFGGSYWPIGASSPTAIANGTVTLTANATNYIFADPGTGAVGINTTGFPTGKVPLYSVVVPSGATTFSSYLDYRSYQPSAVGGAVQSIANEGATGVGVYDATNSTLSQAVLKSLLSSGVIGITPGATSITISGAGGTVQTGSNEGAGAPVLDATSTSPTLTTKNLSGTGTMAVTDGGTEAILSLTGAPLASQQAGSTVVAATTLLRPSGRLSAASGGSGVANFSLTTMGPADTVPVLTGLTVLNPASATVTQAQQAWGVQFTNATAATLAGVGVAVPGAPYRAEFRFNTQPTAISTQGGGPVLYDSGSGKWKFFEYYNNSGPRLVIQNWSAAGTVAATLGTFGAPSDFFYIRIRDNGTNWYYEVSPDGNIWETLYSEARNTYLTPTHVGHGSLTSTGYTAATTIFSMYVGT
ncbi:hypothetical protein [Burkholderia sp. JKS000303]|uniref:hypothetical protein n=1 Tax=Burkholderia sp. JKS000303 TaxID=1938747 RepID=UPI000BF5CB44|nr:hypothetical protein [Burkholderia sp. JKS000303]PFH29154.1 hypothetical protein BX604_2926 [Burkholderia sp. JKS000303]